MSAAWVKASEARVLLTAATAPYVYRVTYAAKKCERWKAWYAKFHSGFGMSVNRVAARTKKPAGTTVEVRRERGRVIIALPTTIEAAGHDTSADRSRAGQTPSPDELSPEDTLLAALFGEATTEEPDPLGELTPRQTHVLFLLQEGVTNKVIANKLGMTERTVKVHLRQIMRRLGTRNRTEAAFLAQQRHQKHLEKKG